MKKISLKSIKADELLSKEELKQIMGGTTGSALPCGTGGRGPGDGCVTGDGEEGTCKYYMGIYGCVPN